MPGFRRVFNAFPGFNVLGQIESVNIIDIPPPVTPLGAGVGVVGIVAEFDTGVFNRPTRVFGGTDLETRFGGFGFTKSGVPFSGPTSRMSADSAQPWEGNGFIALRNKRFAGLVITRVDNSSGSVSVSRLACKTGTLSAPYNLEPGQTLLASIDGAAAATATWDAAAAVRTGEGFPGLAQFALQVDDSGGPSYIDQTANFNSATAADLVLFPATEAIGDVFEVGFGRPFSQLIFDGAGGTAGVGGVVVWEYSTGVGTWSALTGVVDGTSGFTTAVADGQVVSWTVPADWAEGTEDGNSAYFVRARITTVYSTNPIYDQGFVEQLNVTGFLGGETFELSLDSGPTRVVTFTVAEQTLAQVVAYMNSQLAADIASDVGSELSFASLVRGTAASVEVIGGTARATLGHLVGTSTGTGDVANIDSVSQAEIDAVVQADIANTLSGTDIAGLLRICATATPGTGTVQITGGTGLVGLGMTIDAAPISASVGAATATVPAGTRVRDTTTTTDWVTMEDAVFAAGAGGPLSVRVRPWLDNDTAPTAALGTIDTVVDQLDGGFSVTNSLAISRIGGAALDAAYFSAFESTLDVNGVPFDINLMYAARHTENIQRFGRDNALTATATGHRARKFIASPPVGTDIATATGATGVGVANIRNQRMFYAFPAVTTFIPEIARVGTDGGPGFTADGVIQIPSDGFYANVRSLLNPEENAGQRLSDTNVGALNALTLEELYDPEQGGTGLNIENYINFKSSGVIAPRIDRVAGMIFQSDVTSVDPNTDPALADAKRRFMGDFVIDSLFDISINFVKKLNTPARRRALTGQLNGFLNLLKSENQPDLARIEDFSVRDDTTDEQRGLGFQLYTIQVRLFASMDSIVITTEVGTTVVIEEVE